MKTRILQASAPVAILLLTAGFLQTIVPNQGAVNAADPANSEGSDSESAVRDLRALQASVEWVTATEYVSGNPVALPKKDFHYRVTINEHWIGKDDDLTLLNKVDRLKTICIEDAQGITDAGLAKIGKSPGVRSFYLRRIQVTNKGIAFLENFPLLTSLCLQDLPITDEGLTGLRRMTNIEELDLMSMKSVGDATIDSLEMLPRLKFLRLARVGVTDRGLQHLNSNVESLFLTQLAITDDGLKRLEELKHLQVLSLNRTQVSDTGLQHLSRLPQLEWLSLGGTKVTSNGIDSFLKSRPSTASPISIEGVKGLQDRANRAVPSPEQ